MYQRLYRRFVDVPDIGRRLTWFPPRDDGVGVDETEGIYYDFPFYGLNWVNNDGN